MAAVASARPTTSNPPMPLPSGVTAHGDGKVSFALLAPWKKSVSVLGSFNNWNPDQYPLNVSDHGLWWVTLTLPAGEHHYQYRIDGEVTIGDPYAKRIAWDGMGNQPHAVLRLDEQPYEWHDQAYNVPPFNELVIYELHVGDFSPEGTFKGVTARLDYLRDLGINAIELMPVQEFPGDHSWGYNSVFYFVPETAYGSPEDLKELIDQAHARGIAVLLDMVLNHTGQDNPLTMMYPPDKSPWLADPNFKSNDWGMSNFDLWKDATKEFVHDLQAYWLGEYHIDGFRYDALYVIGDDGLNGASFITWDARQSKPHVYLIGEQIPENPHLVAATELNAAWHKRFRDQMMAALCETESNGQQPNDFDAICRVLGADGYEKPEQTVKYLESHDEERVMACLRRVGQEEPTAVQRAKLGAQLLLTAAGLPMIWMGSEFGHDAPKTLESNKLPWDKLETQPAKELLDVYRSLIALHRQHPALHSNGFALLHSDPEQRTFSYARQADENNLVIVAANISNEPKIAKVPFPTGKYHEFIFNFDHDFDGESEVELPPSTCKVFVKID